MLYNSFLLIVDLESESNESDVDQLPEQSEIESSPGSSTGCIISSGCESSISSCPNDIAKHKDQQPVQPVSVKFKATIFSGRKRSFNPDWYRRYRWIEYSIHRNAAIALHVGFLVPVIIEQRLHL